MAEGKDVKAMTDDELLAEMRLRDRIARDDASREAWQTPSTFSNQFHVNIEHDVTRITFGEATSPGGVPVSWRTSVTLTTAQALELADFIWSQYEKASERQMAQEEQEKKGRAANG